MTRKHPKPAFVKLRSFYIWHRYVGVSVFLLVIVLAVTGILLNHTETWKLDSTYVENDILLDWYGIQGNEPVLSYAVGNQNVNQIDDRLYLDSSRLPGRYLKLHGAVVVDDTIAIAVDNNIMVLTYNAQIIEIIGGALGVPSGINAMALQDDRVIVKTPNGNYLSNEDFDEWRAVPVSNIDWVRKTQLPEAQLATIQNVFRRSILPVERVMLDLHSGRIFASWGVYVMDAAAILMLFLSLSGFWMWLVQQHKRRQHRRAQQQHQQIHK